MEKFIKSFERALITQDRWKMYLEGLGNTITIAVLAAIIGTIIGVLLAMVNYLNKKTGKLKFLSKIANVYITIIRGTPVALQLMILYFVVFASWDQKLLIGAITFGMNSSAYVGEIVRAGFESVDDGQREAGRSLGLSTWQTMRFIIIPQALKNSLPPLFNEFITLVKETAIIGWLGVNDLGKVPSMIQSRTFDYLPPLVIAALLYLAVVMLLTFVLRKIEKRFAKSDRNAGGVSEK